MLKIKDNVKLEELENFGFINYDDNYIKECSDRENCFIDKHDKHIFFGCDEICHDLDILFDLISAGLVEKVVEE